MLSINNSIYGRNLIYSYKNIKNNLNNNYDYINKAITDKDTDDNNEEFNVHDSTFSQLIKEDRKLLKDGKITEDDYGCMMIHAFVSRICVRNGKIVYKSDSDYSQDWAYTFNEIQTSHKSAGLSIDDDEDERLQKIMKSLE